MRDVDRGHGKRPFRRARDADGLQSRRCVLEGLLLVPVRDPDLRRWPRDEPSVLRDDEEAVADRTRRKVSVARCERDCLQALGKPFDGSLDACRVVGGSRSAPRNEEKPGERQDWATHAPESIAGLRSYRRLVAVEEPERCLERE